jgi:hypothetical protein
MMICRTGCRLAERPGGEPPAELGVLGLVVRDLRQDPRS